MGSTSPVMDKQKGFKAFTLAESNFNAWEGGAKRADLAGLAKQLDLHVDHVREGRTSDDLLHEILLKSGFPLTTKIDELSVAGKVVYSVADGALLICLDRSLAFEVIKGMADRDLTPERVVCLDQGFAGNDQLKTNSVQTMKARGVTSFRTVFSYWTQTRSKSHDELICRAAEEFEKKESKRRSNSTPSSSTNSTLFRLLWTFLKASL